MNQPAILLVGAGGHARACIDVIEKEGRYVIAGLVGMPDEVGGAVLGYPILGGDAELPALRERCHNALITLGQIQSPEPRIRLFSLLERLGYTLPAVVSPRAHVSRPRQPGAGHHRHARRHRQRQRPCRPQLHPQQPGAGRARRRGRGPLPHLHRRPW
jgi:hypothetical protein